LLPNTIHVYKYGVRDAFRRLHLDLSFFNHEAPSEMMYSLQQHFIRSQDVLFYLKAITQSSTKLVVKSSETHKYVHFVLIGVTISFRSAKNDQAGEAINMFEWTVRARLPDELPFLSFFGASERNNFYLEYVTSLSEIERDAFAAGFDPDRLGVHSLRIGGATMFAAAKYSIHYIQTLGRWKSLAFMSYIYLTLRSMDHAMIAIVDPIHCLDNDLIRLNPSARLMGPLTVL
jgi:hypothetical protein